MRKTFLKQCIIAIVEIWPILHVWLKLQLIAYFMQRELGDCLLTIIFSVSLEMYAQLVYNLP